MTSKQRNEYIKQLRQFGKKLVASKEKAKKFLKDAGIHNKNGELTENYRNPD